jgi:hypothetical protein
MTSDSPRMAQTLVSFELSRLDLTYSRRTQHPTSIGPHQIGFDSIRSGRRLGSLEFRPSSFLEEQS